MASIPWIPSRPDATECPHDELLHLGDGGPSSYYRCVRCDTAIVIQGKRMWTIRAASKS